MGNLLQILTARRLQDAGHVPFALVGGATGMIGDPKDSGERTLNSLDVVKSWVEKVRAQIEPFLSFEGSNAATMVNNYDWTASLSTIDFLRDIGKHFPVNRMLARDVVRSRLEAGISYTEFSYVLLQSMDFLNLHRDHGVTLQFGGSDQWGNITGGVELIRRADGDQVHALATPLVTRADGTKYGKTEGGALWLDPEMLSPYAFYQFWLNVEDEKVGELLRVFTFLSHAGDRGPRGADGGEAVPAGRPEGAGRAHDHAGARRRGDRADQGRLGRAVRRRRPARARRRPRWRAALREAGAAEVAAADGLPTIVDLLVAVRAVQEQGRGAAHGRRGRRLPQQRARRRTPTSRPATTDLLGGAWLVLRRGKKNLAGVEVAEPVTTRAGSLDGARGSRCPRAAARAGATATSARAPATASPPAEAAAAWDRYRFLPAGAARRDRRATPGRRCSGTPLAHAVRGRPDDPAARRCTPTARWRWPAACAGAGCPDGACRATPAPRFADDRRDRGALVAAGLRHRRPRRPACRCWSGPWTPGAAAVVLTVDTPVVGTQVRRRRTDRLGRRRPGLAAGQLPAGLRRDAPGGREGDRPRPAGRRVAGARPPGCPVVVKGVLRPDDARRCVDAGRGRGVGLQPRWPPARPRRRHRRTACAAVVDEVGDAAEVYVDGGVRTGRARAGRAGARGATRSSWAGRRCTRSRPAGRTGVTPAARASSPASCVEALRLARRAATCGGRPST